MQQTMNLNSENQRNKNQKLPTTMILSLSKEKKQESRVANSKEEVTFTISDLILPDVVVEKIGSSNLNRWSDDVSSVVSDSSALYFLVKMTLFTLYVIYIQDDWPKSGRFRKCIDINEGIKILLSQGKKLFYFTLS